MLAIRVSVTLPSVCWRQTMRKICCWAILFHYQMKCQEIKPEIATLNLNLEIEINVEDPLPPNNDSLKTNPTEETFKTESNQNFIVAAVEAEIENEYEYDENHRDARETVFFNSTDSGVSFALAISNETTLTTSSDFIEDNILSSRQNFASSFSTSIKLSTMESTNKTVDLTTIKSGDIQNNTSISTELESLNETLIPSFSNLTKNETSSILLTKTTEYIFETTTTNDQQYDLKNLTDNSTVIGSKTMKGYNNWSLLQLLFFIILLIALGNFQSIKLPLMTESITSSIQIVGSSCCSINAICSYWHFTEWKMQNAIIKLLQEKYENSNKVEDNGVEDLNRPTEIAIYPSHQYSKQRMTSDFVRNALDAYSEENIVQEKHLSSSLFSQGGSTLNSKAESIMDDTEDNFSDPGTTTSSLQGVYF